MKNINDMSNILIEVLSEEMPADVQQDAAYNIANLLLHNIKEKFIKLDNLPFIENFVTPRRLAFYIKGLNINACTHDFEEIRGPKVTAHEDAVDGFMRKYIVQSSDDLKIRGEFFYYDKPTTKKDYKIILKEIIEESLTGFTWSKSMYWGDYKLAWIRPIHSIICLLDNEILPIKLGHIKSGNITYGHRFMSSGEIKINSAEEYIDKMKKANVILSPEDRKNIILDGIKKITSKLKLNILNDEDLLEEIVGLIEYPVVLLGKISNQFMNLPNEVLITVLKVHQKYMMLIDKKNEVAPYYIIVSNIKTSDDNATIIKGNERVLNARLTDAQFFLTNDIKIKLEDRSEGLHKLLFHRDIGTIYEKVERIRKLLMRITEDIGINSENADRAAILMKNDLTTDMVSEFPELQGIMGGYYAEHDGEDIEVVRAIHDHYKPQGPHDYVPLTKLGGILAIADKIDTLQEMFNINIKPTGSKDPYALRRAAIGIIRIISTYKFIIPFSDYGIRHDVLEFISERLNNFDVLKGDFEKINMIQQSLNF